MVFKINEKEFELKMSFRAYMLYENITGKSFEPTTMTDIINFFYCVVITSAKDYDYKYNDFLDALDDNQNLMVEFSEWLTNEYTKNEMLSPSEDEDSKKKVKKK